MRRTRPFLPVPLLASALAAGLVASASSGAQERPAAGRPVVEKRAEPKKPDPKAAETAAEKARREADLKALQDAIAANAEARRKLDAEIASIRTDRAKLSAALIDTAERIRSAEERMRGLEERLQNLTASEAAIRRSLESRREVIVEVFAALQRMGRRPPPAVLVRPEDMLEAVRASILLGAVLPELRVETETLATDLGELVRLKSAIAQDRAALGTEFVALNREQERIAALMAARQDRLADVEKSAGAEKRQGRRTRPPGRDSQRIDRPHGEGHRRRPPRRGRGETGRGGPGEGGEGAICPAPPSGIRPGSPPRSPSPRHEGLLPRPVGGDVAREFGAADGYGGVTRGISIRTRPASLVVSPADGWVAFAGPFRSYGQLLIINAGGGYYLLLAGMDRIDVEVGQFVLAGEPVATMGKTSARVAGGGSDRVERPRALR